MKFEIARAWKDAAYRASLNAEEQALLPASPAGEFELSEADLVAVQGAHGGQIILNSFETAAGCLQSDAAPCITVVGNCLNSVG
jgi:mersacidin/lichenicidin family type 2 lantibiotic